MRRLIGVVYLSTGLVCVLVDLLVVGRPSLGGTFINFARGLLESLGSDLLILSGVVILIENVRRSVLCLITGSVVVAGLALWTVQFVGWRNATLRVLEPTGVFLLASLIVLLVKKRWVLALLGSIASAPSALLHASLLLFLWGYTAGEGPWTLREISLIFPLVFALVSFVCAVSARTE